MSEGCRQKLPVSEVNDFFRNLVLKVPMGNREQQHTTRKRGGLKESRVRKLARSARSTLHGRVCSQRRENNPARRIPG